MWQPEELHEVNCDLCGSNDFFFVIQRPDGLNVVECLHCGLAFLNPRPSEEVIYRLYDDYYFFRQNDSNANSPKSNIGYVNYASDSIERSSCAELNCLEKIYPLKGRHVLEIGCATGELLTQAQKRGARTIGVEISKYAAEISRERYALDVRIGTLEAQNFPDKFFDVIIALEVIEHLSSPSNFLYETSRILKRGGMVALSTPNYRCARHLKERWIGFQTSFEHLFFVSDKVLKKMAAAQDLRCVYWSAKGSGYSAGTSDSQPQLKTLVKQIPGSFLLLNFLKGKFIQDVRAFLRPGHKLFAIFQKK
jgi:2-polyprenyl-3-methyl-5-hydroxy-6-metoxy-1,4-benzoquinol methylase